MPKKNILLIMPNFFDYPESIINSLKEKGYSVDFFDDRPSTNSVIKAAIRINPGLVRKLTERYFKRILQTITSKKYEYFILISGQSLALTEKMILTIKNCHPEAKTVLYQWDSLTNFPAIEKYYPIFQCIYSFDPGDAKNKRINFLPLFYTEKYEKIGKHSKGALNFDFCFVGTAHPKKYRYISEMADELKEAYPKQYIYFYLPSKMLFFYRKISSKEFRYAHYHDFEYTPLSGEQMDSLLLKSRCILDSPQSGQNGLTIRVIEALGARKKIITTNANVCKYDFYRPENIYIYRGGKFDFHSKFFTEPYTDIDGRVYKEYSLSSWIETLLYS